MEANEAALEERMGAPIGSPPPAAAVVPLEDAEDVPDFELGDKVAIVGGRYDGTRGRIYYMNEDLIRIMPDGVSDRVIDIAIVEGELDPELGITNFFSTGKRAEPAFVAQIDARKGYLVDAFDANGKPVGTYTIEEVDETEDQLTLKDESGAMLTEVILPFIGISQDQQFAVLRVRQPPGAIDDEAAAAANAATEENEGFEFLEEVVPPEPEEEFAGLQEIPKTRRLYSDNVQRNDMIKEMIAALDVSARKNPKKQIFVRKLVEQCILLRNEIVSYNRSGEPEGKKSASYQTVSELLEKGDAPLARPVADAKRSLYAPHSDAYIKAATTGERGVQDVMDLTPLQLDLQYQEDVMLAEKEFMASRLGTAPAAPADFAGALPAWFTGWETYFRLYMRSFLMNQGLRFGQDTTFRKDKEFLRGPIGLGGTATVDAILSDIADAKDEPSAAQGGGAAEGPEDEDMYFNLPTGRIKVGLQKGLGPRYTRLKKGAPTKIESGDDLAIMNQLLFPASTARDLGATRSGRLTRDIVMGARQGKSMKQILEELGGVPEQATTGSILAMGPGGNTTGNIAISDWLKAQPIVVGGLGDVLVELVNLGLAEKELTTEQQEVLLEKMDQYRALLKQHLQQLQEAAARDIAGLRLENQNFLQGEALEQFEAVLSEEPLLATAAGEMRKRLPAYKDNDMAAFIYLSTQMSDLMLAAMAGLPGPIARERNRKVRDQFLVALKAAAAKRHVQEMSGAPPQPINCPHVQSLDAIRKIRDDSERMRALAKFLDLFKRGRKDNWVLCSASKDNHILLCQHEVLQLDEFLRPKEKDAIHKELLLGFSGGQFNGQYMCKNCGQPISSMDFDSGMEFDEDGLPQATAAAVGADAAEEEAEERLNQMLEGPVDAEEPITFDTELQTLIYKTCRQTLTKVGIPANSDAYQRIVQRVEADIQRQPSREDYAKAARAREAAAAKGAGPARMIDYDVLINRILVTSAGAHCLIECQTNIPGYVVRSRLPGARAGFTGYPIGKKEDRTGIEYIAFAIAGIRDAEAPWNLTGFQREPSVKKRQDAIAAGIDKMATEAMKVASVQQAVAMKRAYLEQLFGRTEEGGSLTEVLRPGFRPVPYAPTAAEAAATAVVPAGATEKEAVRAWIQTGHQIAKANGNYIKGNPFSEVTCCFGPVDAPRRFWAEKERDMPALPAKTAPAGQSCSYLGVHFSPRKTERLIAETPQELLYRVFLKVCYDGPRKGLPHEPGYTNKCPHCGFVFPQSLYTPLPAAPTSKDLFEEWHKEMEAIVTRGKAALETQKVPVNPGTFEDLLDTTHTLYKVEMPERAPPVAGMALLARFQDLTLEPFEGWRALMADTISRVSMLPPGANDTDVAIAYGPLSNFYAAALQQIQERMGARASGILQALLLQSPVQIVESLQAYILVPFQRVLNKFKAASLKVQPGLDVGTSTVSDLEKILSSHLTYLKEIEKKCQGIAKPKMERVRDVLVVTLHMIRDQIRSAYMPGSTMAIQNLLGALVAGIFAEFINGNLGAIDGAPGVDPFARSPAQILDICLGRLRDEGLNFTEDQIRDMIAQRNEIEKQYMIGRFRDLNDDEKRVELLNKRLGLGAWAVGGTKAIRVYNEEHYELEKQQRLDMGFNEFTFGGDVPAGAGGVGEVFGGAGRDEDGYDHQQETADNM
jgi:hypothetical protein